MILQSLFLLAVALFTFRVAALADFYGNSLKKSEANVDVPNIDPNIKKFVERVVKESDEIIYADNLKKCQRYTTWTKRGASASVVLAIMIVLTAFFG